MGSLLGDVARLVSVRNQVPVPMSGRGVYTMSTLALGGSDDEAYMRSYGTVGTIFSMVSLFAAATAAPEWHMYRKSTDNRVRYSTNDTGSDQRVEVVKHQALSVLNAPNPFYTRFRLFEAAQQHLDLTGKAFWVVEYDPRASFPLGLWPVRPDRMEPVPDPDKFLAGWVYTAPDGRERVPLGVNDVFFCNYPDPLDCYGGTGPVQSVLTDIDSAKYSAEYNRNYFINGAEPGSLVEVPNALSDDEFNQMSDRWRETHKGVSRAHRVAFLENGAKWVQTSTSMKDMDFANLRSVSRDVMREAFRMHKVMLGVSDDVNRANAQTGEEVFSNWGVVPRLDRWKDALNHFFLPLFGSTGQGVEFDYVRPIPTNREQDNEELAAKSAAAQVLVASGFDPHAVLEVVGLPDMEVVETATQAPSLPPGWVPAGAPGAPADPDAGEAAAEAAGGGDDMTNRLRKMLSNGHMPVLAGKR